MATEKSLVVGIVLIVLGVLLLLGELIGLLILAASIGLIVLGILMVVGRVKGGTMWGAAAIVLGILLLVSDRLLPASARDDLGRLVDILRLVLGIVLLVFGILKVAGKR